MSGSLKPSAHVRRNLRDEGYIEGGTDWTPEMSTLMALLEARESTGRKYLPIGVDITSYAMVIEDAIRTLGSVARATASLDLTPH